MANQIKDFFAAKARHRNALNAIGDPYPYLYSKESWKIGTTEGRVSQVNVDIAASCLAYETHRLATPEEIEAYKAAENGERKFHYEQEMKGAQKVVYYQAPPPPEQVPTGRKPKGE